MFTNYCHLQLLRMWCCCSCFRNFAALSNLTCLSANKLLALESWKVVCICFLLEAYLIFWVFPGRQHSFSTEPCISYSWIICLFVRHTLALCQNDHTYICLSTESSSNSNEIWCVGRGRWVMHDCMPYGWYKVKITWHWKLETLPFSKCFSSLPLSMGAASDCWFLN